MIDATTRKRVAERAGYRCEYCGCPSEFSSSPYAIEHIQPRDLGGTDELDNLAWSCSGCNGHKATATHATHGHDPITQKWVMLFHPRRDQWLRHFAWSADQLMIEGKTATGRATVERLKLNRLSVVNLRRVLILANEYLRSS